MMRKQYGVCCSVPGPRGEWPNKTCVMSKGRIATSEKKRTQKDRMGLNESGGP